MLVVVGDDRATEGTQAGSKISEVLHGLSSERPVLHEKSCTLMSGTGTLPCVLRVNRLPRLPNRDVGIFIFLQKSSPSRRAGRAARGRGVDAPPTSSRNAAHPASHASSPPQPAQQVFCFPFLNSFLPRACPLRRWSPVSHVTVLCGGSESENLVFGDFKLQLTPIVGRTCGYYSCIGTMWFLNGEEI